MDPTTQSPRLLDPTFLFRFSFTVPHYDADPLGDQWNLPDSCIVPAIGELAGRKQFGELRAAWNKRGLLFQVTVIGKTQYPWCRPSRIDESDGLYLWIDTRNSPGIQRATRFCHLFVLTPMGGGPKADRPIGQLIPIPRAKENPHEIASGMVQLRSKLARTGYQLSIGISSIAMTGYDPLEYPKLGFYYAIADRELGWQALTLNRELPVAENPSLWSEVELIQATS